MNCLCGHLRNAHDLYDGCLAFLCCDRRLSTFPGKRHTEHDGVTHQPQPCRCRQFTDIKDTA